MKKQRVRNSALLNKPQGNGLASASQSHKPQGNGLACASQSHKPQGNGLASASQSHKPQGNGLACASQNHSAEKARAYAFLLLKFRLRSESELASRLRRKKFSESVIQNTLSFLRDKEFIDDFVFAKGWVKARLRQPLGLRRIKQELTAKGIDKEIIEDSLAQVKKDYNENQIVNQLAQKRFSRLKGIEPQKAKMRVYAYLLRRGFSPDIVSDTVKQL